MRIVFFGSGIFAIPALEAVAAAHEVVAVFCPPPRPAGRAMRLTSSPLAEAARGMSLPVFEEAADAARLRAMRADAAAVCDYGIKLSAAVLESFPRGALNIHPSLLPRWRGPEPIIRAMLADDNETGVCIMQLDEGMDTGAILLRERVAISPTITGGELSDALAKIGARLLLRALSENPAPQAQTGEATHAAKIAAAERELDFRLSAEVLARRVRAFAPSPSAFACLPDGERIKIIAAEVAERKPEWATMQSGDIAADASGALIVICGEKSLSLLRLQRPGKKPLAAADFVRGMRLPLSFALKRRAPQQ